MLKTFISDKIIIIIFKFEVSLNQVFFKKVNYIIIFTLFFVNQNLVFIKIFKNKFYIE